MASNWYTVRTVVHRMDEGVFQERITLWRRADPDEAAEAALAESTEYASDVGGIDCGLAQVYEPYGDDVAGLRAAAEGCEIFSLVRQSELDTGRYLDTFFDTGREQQHVI
ncbi:MAG TPA: hypothetical protein VJM49_11565 [Acidimicrobiales bacterium]|nr:hypothetical protein [Acidimicrobiales bacterium]